MAWHGGLAVATTFLGSLLLFSLEPYVEKLLLPAFGGAPLLWNTCMVFYQVALLLGYLYALDLARYVPVRGQVAIQLLLLVALFLDYPDAQRLAAAGTGDPFLCTRRATPGACSDCARTRSCWNPSSLCPNSGASS